jgi:NhaA family Na+:H+ antiporter
MADPNHGVPRRTAGRLQVRSTGSPISRRFIAPAQRFIFTEGATGRLLLAAAILSLLLANSPWAGPFEAIWAHRVLLDLGFLSVEKDIRHLVNDGAMTLFFFLVTMEVKHELLEGTLSSRSRAMLPLFAALGGMVVPAAIYLALNAGTEAGRGWGIPLATDIAFAVAALQLLTRGAAASLVGFLLALAVVDDIGAILVIAVFYTDALHVNAALAAVGMIGVILVAQRVGLDSIGAYWVLGMLLWFAVLESGVHATIAGVILATLTPARAALLPELLPDRVRPLLDRVEQAIRGNRNGEAEEALGEIETVVVDTESPLTRLEREVHPWTGYLVLPLFALANSGVALDVASLAAAFASSATIGIIAGLWIGKPLGIVLFSWLAVRLGIATLPAGMGWSHVLGAGALAGIGFSVSLFITELAFTDPALVEQAKTGVLAATLLAAATGAVALRVLVSPRRAVEAG